MSEDGQREGKPSELGLTEFLADLRADLQSAQEQAGALGGSGEGGLRLGVEEITVTLEVAHVATHSGEVSGKVSGKFWVFGSVEAGAKGAMERQRSGTQTLTLTLRPRVDKVTKDEHGNKVVSKAGVDVEGNLAEGEQMPKMPLPPGG